MTAEPSPRARFLADVDWVAAHLHDPALRLVDMRGYVRTVDGGVGLQHATYAGAADEYAQGHLPGALYLDWTRDIVDLDDTVPAQVATPEQFATTLGAHGIGDEHLIVAYDAHPASQFATRLWWALRYYGHDRVMVLDGGLRAWQRRGLPLTTEVPAYAPAIFTPRVQHGWRISGTALLAQLGDPALTLLDARDAGQYTGELRRDHGRAGHIPGAINLPRERLIDPASGTFRSDNALRAIFSEAGLPSQAEAPIVAYCNGGVAATTLLFGLTLVGYHALANYDGSWNEWGSRPEWPVTTA